MAKLTSFEKFFVNKRGESFFVKLVNELESNGSLKIDGKSRILELGGGNGALSSLLYDRFHPAAYTLTDYDPDQVAFAKRSIEERFGGLPPAFVLQQADATKLVYKDDSFDLVIAHLILHHLGGMDEISAGLREIDRVLVPGGTFLYAEFAHKKELRARLSEMGYKIRFRKGLHRETVVAIKHSGATNSP